mmetsp:Transcript_4270/g.11061  ORF Transcript_4270/g.11061 Transcript_4270/m.11061 type:complete len:182 (-) Transcript_4270:164-709(-)
MDQRRGVVDDLVYGRDLDHREAEVPVTERPEYAGAAGIAYQPDTLRADWTTSGTLATPAEVMATVPDNPAARPYAGLRCSLAFRTSAVEMPAHMVSFAARDFTDLRECEAMRAKAVALNQQDAEQEAQEIAIFTETIARQAMNPKLALDFLNAGDDGMVNDSGEFNDYTHAGKDTYSSIRI